MLKLLLFFLLFFVKTFIMFGFKVICWALLFIFKLKRERFNLQSYGIMGQLISLRSFSIYCCINAWNSSRLEYCMRCLIKGHARFNLDILKSKSVKTYLFKHAFKLYFISYQYFMYLIYILNPIILIDHFSM